MTFGTHQQKKRDYQLLRAPGVGRRNWTRVDQGTKGSSLLATKKAGMWITADFRLYPPVITANQELVSPTGDHRYRGGTERAHPRGFRV